MKVCMYPTPDEIESNHGIGRIIHAMYKYLPALGVEFTENSEAADLVATHTQMFDYPSVDVLHLHGMYWTGDPGSGEYYPMHHHANRMIVEGVRQARLVTVPSQWCTEVFKRDMRLTPLVVGHGIDFSECGPGESLGYVLWNKNRDSDVCDPTPAWELAQRGVSVVSTFSKPRIDPPPTMQVVGALPHDKMKILVRAADVYLATVKETYGIGTLEAMACGVPVLGYNHGGTADIVQHGVTGYLVKPGDIDGLMEGYEYIRSHRSELSANAREYASSRDWSKVIGQYAQVYAEAMGRKAMARPKTSIVITNYNYAGYVDKAVSSALNQTVPCEVIVVDDGSTDNSREVLDKLPTFGTTLYQKNQGVAEARNAGIRKAAGDYIICLDADDMLDSRYVETLQMAMDADRGLGVAYSGLGLINESLDRIDPNPGWPVPFRWESQSKVTVPPNNCIPCAAMFRRSMWERAGGYKQEYAPGEDTEFFTRGLSVGFTAQQVVTEPLFFYRAHGGSASRTKEYIAIDTFLPWMRDKRYPIGAPLDDKKAPVVPSYSTPAVSVIIPVGNRHLKYLSQALDSLLGQTMRNWEVVVVYDDSPVKVQLAAYPFVREFYHQGGSGACRNFGLAQARAPLSLFLDADDWLMPDALTDMCRAYGEHGGRYIYTDWLAVHGAGPTVEWVPDYNELEIVKVPQHAVTVLIGTEAAKAVKFNESLRYLEDWDFFARCAIVGTQGWHLAKRLVAVRIHRDRKTTEWTATENDREKTFREVALQFVDYSTGGKPMGSCCGGNGDSVIAAKIAAGYMSMPPEEPAVGNFEPEVTRIQFIGAATASQTYGGPGITTSGRRYRGANNPLERNVDADPRDVAWLVNTGDWQVVRSKPSETPPAQMETIMQVLSRQQPAAPAMAPQDSPVTPVPEKSIPEPIEEPQEDSGIMLAKRPRKGRKPVAVQNDPA